MACAKTTFGHATQRTRTYNSWRKMHERCKSHPNYIGITVCKRWSGKEGFKNFLEDMGERPEQTSIDRFPTTSSVYSKENCRWASPVLQVQNKRKFKKRHSKFLGVGIWKRKNGFKFGAQIKIKGKSIFLGVANSEIEAAKLYNEAAKNYYGKKAFLNDIESAEKAMRD